MGLNFAIEKWCAKSGGTCIFIPSFHSFLSRTHPVPAQRGEPNSALFSDSDGLHPDGAGVDVLESIFQQAFSTGYLLTRIRADRTQLLKALPY